MAQPPHSDHDYTYSYKFSGGQQPPVKAEVGSAWIEEDAPPMVSPVIFNSYLEMKLKFVNGIMNVPRNYECPALFSLKRLT